jgi:hypothetical protein
MTVKTKTVTVSAGWYNHADAAQRLYKVEKVTDSVELTPGEMLFKKQVEDLCCSREWKVTVVPIKG